MKFQRSSGRNSANEIRVLFSPSTHRVIAPVSAELTGTIQLDKVFRTERVIYAAPIDLKDMSDSWSNQEIDDWEERNIKIWSDLADPSVA